MEPPPKQPFVVVTQNQPHSHSASSVVEQGATVSYLMPGKGGI